MAHISFYKCLQQLWQQMTAIFISFYIGHRGYSFSVTIVNILEMFCYEYVQYDHHGLYKGTGLNWGC